MDMLLFRLAGECFGVLLDELKIGDLDMERIREPFPTFIFRWNAEIRGRTYRYRFLVADKAFHEDSIENITRRLRLEARQALRSLPKH